MSRKNLYEIIKEKQMTPTQAFMRIRYQFDHVCHDVHPNGYAHCRSMNVKDFICEHIFQYMPIAEARINLNDLLLDLGIALSGQKESFDDVFVFIELIWCAVDSTPDDLLRWTREYSGSPDIYSAIEHTIKITLDKLGYKEARIKEGRIVVAKNYKADQAAMLTNEEQATWDLMQYNHYSNNGNLSSKQSILKRLGDYLEPDLQTRKDCDDAYLCQTANMVSELLNNYHIRHNNKDGNKKKGFVISMSDEELETWYDRTYNAIVAYIIEKEASDTARRMKAHRKQEEVNRQNNQKSK